MKFSVPKSARKKNRINNHKMGYVYGFYFHMCLSFSSFCPTLPILYFLFSYFLSQFICFFFALRIYFLLCTWLYDALICLCYLPEDMANNSFIFSHLSIFLVLLVSRMHTSVRVCLCINILRFFFDSLHFLFLLLNKRIEKMRTRINGNKT